MTRRSASFLRRMDEEDDPTVRYAIVVPPASLSKAVRVEARVRDLLRIDVYVVDPDSDEVRRA